MPLPIGRPPLRVGNGKPVADLKGPPGLIELGIAGAGRAAARAAKPEMRAMFFIVRICCDCVLYVRLAKECEAYQKLGRE